MNKENDLLAGTMIWCQVSGSDTSMMRICECIAKLLCHTSLLMVDDYRLRDRPPSSRICELCDLYTVRTNNVRTGPYVQCNYRSVCILYVNELDIVNTVNDIILRKLGR